MTEQRYSKKSPLKWGILGCGNVTEIKSGPAYKSTPGFCLVGVTRRDLQKARDYAERHQISTVFESPESMIKSPEVDAVYIATPPDSHMKFALEVAAAGKICCVEKPMARNYEECKKMVEAFQKSNVPLFVAYYRRSLPRFNKIKEWLDKGYLGSVRHVSWHLSKPPNDIDKSGTYNWRTDSGIAPGGYFDDLASHGIDLLIYLLGDIKVAKGISLNQQGFYNAKDAVVASFLFESDATGSASWNFGADRREDSVCIYGSKGKITFSVFGEQEIILDSEDKVESLFIENPEHIQLYHVRNMVRHLNGEAVHPSTGKTAAKTSWVMDQILG